MASDKTKKRARSASAKNAARIVMSRPKVENLPKVEKAAPNLTSSAAPDQAGQDSQPPELAEALEVVDPHAIPSAAEDEEPKDAVSNTLPIPAQPSGLVRYDPLAAYMHEIRAYPHLDKDQEKELALHYYHEKNLDAAYKLVTSNLWLVVKIAHDYEQAARSILDLIQEGNMGLMEAVKNYDPYRGVRFPSYAVWWIKAYMVRYLIANWRLVKIGTTQAQRKLFFNLAREKARLQREGFEPAPKLIADRLSVRESDVIEMEQRLAAPDMSVDAPLQADSDNTLLSILPANQTDAEELVANEQLKQLLKQGLDEFSSTLKPNESLIFKTRMLAEEKATLQEIADRLQVSPERVRQIENRIKEKLKVFLQERLGTEIEHFG